MDILPPIPEHLATLGMFDGQLGMATLGFIVEPDISPRFPFEVVVKGDKLLAFVEESGLCGIVEAEGDLGGAVEGDILDIFGIFIPNGLLTAVVDGERFDLEGAVVDGDMLLEWREDRNELEAAVADGDELEAEVAEVDLEALVETVDDEFDGAEVEERPGEGRCSK